MCPTLIVGDVTPTIETHWVGMASVDSGTEGHPVSDWGLPVPVYPSSFPPRRVGRGSNDPMPEW